MKPAILRLTFAAAALYDGLLGVAFLVAWATVFDRLGIPPVNHPGYIQFAAALLIIFALMFAAVALHPRRNANLIIYGILLKVAYISVAGFHWWQTDIPLAWKPFVVIDAGFLVLFALAWRTLHRRGSSA